MENKRYKKEQDIHLTKEEYLAQLKKYLKRLPKEDYNNAMDYFTEYFEDAGSEGETSLMQELGTPKEAAYDILDNLISEKKKDPGTPVWKIILLTFLAICAAPLGGSLLIAVIATALACVLVIIAGLLCIFALGAASVIIGGKLFLRGAVAITASLSSTERMRLESIREKVTQLKNITQLAFENGDYGADKWLQHHEKNLERINKLLNN